MTDHDRNPYRAPVAPAQLLQKQIAVRMKTPHLRFVALALVAVLLAPFTMCISIALALFVGPILDHASWLAKTGASPKGMSVWKHLSMAFAIAVPLILASFFAFFCVCAPTGGLVFGLGGPFLTGSEGGPAYGLMLLLGGLVLSVSTYLGLLLPYRIWRSKGHFDLDTSGDDTQLVNMP